MLLVYRQYRYCVCGLPVQLISCQITTHAGLILKKKILVSSTDFPEVHSVWHLCTLTHYLDYLKIRILFQKWMIGKALSTTIVLLKAHSKRCQPFTSYSYPSSFLVNECEPSAQQHTLVPSTCNTDIFRLFLKTELPKLKQN